MTCEEPTRLTLVGGGVEWHPCQMDPGHRGHHSVTAYTCDGCGKRRRYPWRQQDEEGITLCFLCTVRDDRRYAFMP